MKSYQICITIICMQFFIATSPLLGSEEYDEGFEKWKKTRNFRTHQNFKKNAEKIDQLKLDMQYANNFSDLQTMYEKGQKLIFKRNNQLLDNLSTTNHQGSQNLSRTIANNQISQFNQLLDAFNKQAKFLENAQTTKQTQQSDNSSVQSSTPENNGYYYSWAHYNTDQLSDSFQQFNIAEIPYKKPEEIKDKKAVQFVLAIDQMQKYIAKNDTSIQDHFHALNTCADREDAEILFDGCNTLIDKNIKLSKKILEKSPNQHKEFTDDVLEKATLQRAVLHALTPNEGIIRYRQNRKNFTDGQQS